MIKYNNFLKIYLLLLWLTEYTQPWSLIAITNSVFWIIYSKSFKRKCPKQNVEYTQNTPIQCNPRVYSLPVHFINPCVIYIKYSMCSPFYMLFVHSTNVIGCITFFKYIIFGAGLWSHVLEDWKKLFLFPLKCNKARFLRLKLATKSIEKQAFQMCFAFCMRNA